MLHRVPRADEQLQQAAQGVAHADYGQALHVKGISPGILLYGA